MQGVLVFASAAARDAAITSPQEGQFAFTKDTNGLWYYDGAAWVASGATGDIEGVTAGIGISGGGTSGTVTITNSMATAIDAKGDLVAGTGADAFAKLTVGANGTVLTADSAEATGLKWASAGGAAYTYTDFTPTLANVTIGNGTTVARYVEIGKTVFFYVNFTLGSTSAVTGRIRLDYPIAVKNLAAAEAANLDVTFYEDGIGPVFGGTITAGSTTNFEACALNTAGTYGTISVTSSSVPFTWGTADQILLSGFYERT
jgi:hypothetical protein